jgi:hypothetical protein
MKTYKFELKTGKAVTMDINELTRWACLIEGIEKVSNKCEELGIGADGDEWIKPLAFQKYIEERFHSMKHDLTVETIMGRL